MIKTKNRNRREAKRNEEEETRVAKATSSTDPAPPPKKIRLPAVWPMIRPDPPTVKPYSDDEWAKEQRHNFDPLKSKDRIMVS